MEAKFPHNDEPDIMVWLEYIREHIEQLAMCHSCVYFGNRCPTYTDAERPCSGYKYKQDLIAENLTDDLKMMEHVIKMVEELQDKAMDVQ